jgi:serine/threonine-protein kinase
MVARNNTCDSHRLRRLLVATTDADDPEVARHLESCSSCRDELERMAAESAWWSKANRILGESTNVTIDEGAHSAPHDANRRARIDATLDFLEPSANVASLGRLGPYEVTEVIGRGGMGVVLKGFDIALNRYVAIKVLAAELATSGPARKRFAREAQAAAAVVHDHVVAIHAVDENGRLPYLVMPYIAGRSLQDRIDHDGPLAVTEILRIGMQVASGLAAAHAQGLVHRDIKPANILLENGVERVKITDFGLARAVDDASLTRSGVIAGTPLYMSPEQTRGEPLDHRSDLFSLGSVLYAMAAGHSPFRTDNTMGVLRRICEDTPRPLREVNPEIPSWLGLVVEKLLRKSPADRFQSAAEVAELLGQYLAYVQQPTLAPRPRDIEPLAPPRQQVRRWVLGVGAASLFAGIATLLATRLPDAASQNGNPTNSDVPTANFVVPVPKKQSSRGNRTSSRTTVDPIDAELADLGRDTTSLEEKILRFTPQGPIPCDVMVELDQRLDQLQQELAPAAAQAPPMRKR